MKTPINRRTVQQHLTYAWWKYALVIVLGAALVNIYFTVSAYRSPAEKKIELYVYGACDQDKLDAYLEEVRITQLPEMEEVRSLMMTTDSTYGPMQLTTYVAAGEGDIYVLPREQFVSMASSGAWVALEDDEALTSLFTERGISLQSGWRREADSRESHLYGLPVAQLPGLRNYLYTEDGYLCVLVSNGNDANVMRMLEILCEDMLEQAD